MISEFAGTDETKDANGNEIAPAEAVHDANLVHLRKQKTVAQEAQRKAATHVGQVIDELLCITAKHQGYSVEAASLLLRIAGVPIAGDGRVPFNLHGPTQINMGGPAGDEKAEGAGEEGQPEDRPINLEQELSSLIGMAETRQKRLRRNKQYSEKYNAKKAEDVEADAEPEPVEAG